MANRSSGIGGCSLALAVLFGVVAGIGWAVFSSGKPPAEVWARVKGTPPEKPAPPPVIAPPPSKGGGKKAGPAIPPTNTTPTPTPSSNLYSPADMKAHQGTVDAALFMGDLTAARKAIEAIKTERVPPEHRAWYDQIKPRIEAYLALLRLTDDGVIRAIPKLTNLTLPDSSLQTVRVIEMTEAKVHFESFTGVRVGLARSMLKDSPVELPEKDAYIAVYDELLQRAKKRRVKLQMLFRGADRGFTASGEDGAKPNPIDCFDLADFAVHWGLAAAVPALFELAYKDSPTVAGKVEEVKGQRLTKLFLVYFSMRNYDEARRVLSILNERFNKSDAFRRLADGQLAEYYKEATQRDLMQDAPELAKATPPPDPVTPPEPDPPPPTTQSKDTARAETLTLKGDQAFQAAMGHVERANPNSNPDGADAENRKAMGKLQEARGYYQEAQEIYDNAGAKVPGRLVEQIRRATQELFFARKRAV